MLSEAQACSASGAVGVHFANFSWGLPSAPTRPEWSCPVFRRVLRGLRIKQAIGDDDAQGCLVQDSSHLRIRAVERAAFQAQPSSAATQLSHNGEPHPAHASTAGLEQWGCERVSCISSSGRSLSGLSTETLDALVLWECGCQPITRSAPGVRFSPAPFPGHIADRAASSFGIRPS